MADRPPPSLLGITLRTTWVIAMLVIVAKLALALRDIALAQVAGVAPAVDLFQLLFAVTAFVHAGLGSVAGMLLVPLLAGLAPGPRARIAARAEGALALGGLAICVALWMAAAATRVFGQVPPGAAMTVPLVAAAAMCLTIPALLVSGAFMARLQLAGDTRYVLAEIVPAATAIAVLYALPAFRLDAFCIAILLGTCGQVAVLVALLRARGERAGLRLAWAPIRLRAFPPGLGWLLLGQGIVSLQLVLDPYIATLFGEGAVSRFAYGYRIVNMGITLALTVIARVLFARFALLLADGEDRVAWRLARQFMVLGAAVGLAVGVVVATLADRITALVFFRASFSAADAQAVADILRHAAGLFAPCLAALVLLQLANAASRYRVLFAAAALAFVVKYSVMAALLRPLALNAIPFASTAWYVVILAVYWIALSRRFGGPTASRSPSARSGSSE
ncbi:lipid II flippase MurJ [Sphingomonas hengshuiensis]|nr:lipid II flippase MurJ [Sphingomonas hengshuiensis]